MHPCCACCGSGEWSGHGKSIDPKLVPNAVRSIVQDQGNGNARAHSPDLSPGQDDLRADHIEELHQPGKVMLCPADVFTCSCWRRRWPRCLRRRCLVKRPCCAAPRIASVLLVTWSSVQEPLADRYEIAGHTAGMGSASPDHVAESKFAKPVSRSHFMLPQASVSA